MMALPIPSGGHISHGRRDFYGTAGLVHGLEIEYFAFDKEEMNIDVDKTTIVEAIITFAKTLFANTLDFPRVNNFIEIPLFSDNTDTL